MADAAREDGEIQHGKDTEPDFGKKYPLENRSADCGGMPSTCTLPGLWLGLNAGCSLPRRTAAASHCLLDSAAEQYHLQGDTLR